MRRRTTKVSNIGVCSDKAGAILFAEGGMVGGIGSSSFLSISYKYYRGRNVATLGIISSVWRVYKGDGRRHIQFIPSQCVSSSIFSV